MMLYENVSTRRMQRLARFVCRNEKLGYSIEVEATHYGGPRGGATWDVKIYRVMNYVAKDGTITLEKMK